MSNVKKFNGDNKHKQQQQQQQQQQYQNKSILVQWGTRKVISWTNSPLLNEVGHQLQQMFAGENFWNPVEILTQQYMEEHPEEHWIWIRWKSSNYRAYLIFFTLKGRPTTCILKSNNNTLNYEMFFVRFRVSPELFKGTWWTVEIEEDINGGWWTCWLEDIWFLCGRDVRTDNLTTRLNESWITFQQQWQPDPAIESIQIRQKPGFYAKNAGSALEWLRLNLPKMNRSTTDICFWSLSTMNRNKKFSVLDIQSWTDAAQNWIKPNSKPPINLIQTTQPDNLPNNTSLTSSAWNEDSCIFACWRTEHIDVYNLTTCNRTGMHGEEIGIACIPNMNLSRKIYDWFDGKPNEVFWIRAEYNPWFGKWVPIETVEEGRKELSHPDDTPPQRFWTKTKTNV